MKHVSISLIICAFFLIFAAQKHPAFAETCSPPQAGNLELTADCSFAGIVNGVDSGTGDTNDAILTISAGILTIMPGQTIAFGSLILNGGAIAIPANSSLLLPGASLWMTDSDADGFPESTDQIAATENPGLGTRRRAGLNDINTADCYDGNPDVFVGQTLFFSVDRGDGSFDYDCDGDIIKQRDICSCGCTNLCLAIPECVATDVTAEATDCGATGINAGPVDCTRSDDIYGNCVACTGSGTTETTMTCR